MRSPKVTFFVVDTETGCGDQFITLPSIHFVDSYIPPSGHHLVQFDQSLGDAKDFEVVREGDTAVFLPRQVDADAALLIAKNALWAKVKELRDRAFRVTPTEYGAFDSDQAGRDNIAGKLDEWSKRAELGMALPDDVTWKLADNSFVTLTRQQLTEVGVRFSEYRGDVYLRSWQLEAEIFGAETIEDLATINITQGWP